MWEPRETEWKEYWCPSGQDWVLCEGPCPDGQEHDQVRMIKKIGLAWTGTPFKNAQEMRAAVDSIEYKEAARNLRD